jgi:hypothetical protein
LALSEVKSEKGHMILNNLSYWITNFGIQIIIFGGLLVIIILILKYFNTRKKITWVQDQEYVLLQISVPKENEKSPLAAEQMFAALHGIWRDSEELKKDNAIQEHLSFEIISTNKSIQFYAFVPKVFESFVIGQIYAHYPSVEIKTVEDYATDEAVEGMESCATELQTTKSEFFPIKTFVNFDVDPLAGITGSLSEIKADEHIWIQILMKPVSDAWQKNAIAHVDAIRAGTESIGSIHGAIAKHAKSLAKDVVRHMISPPDSKAKPKEEVVELPAPMEAGLKGIEEKVTKLGFETKIRIISWAPTKEIAKNKLYGVLGAFKQFNTTNTNGFAHSKIFANNEELAKEYQSRIFNNKGYIFNIEELASIFHLPSVSVETPSIVWAGSKKGEPPADLPIEGSTDPKELALFAETDYRNSVTKFGLKNDDRLRHIYTIGKTGTGKSTMLENMVIDDIQNGKGVAVVDPHGDFIEHLMDCIPEERINDVVVFDPSDRDHPVGFNLLENIDQEQKGMIASGLIGIFQKIWAFSWGPRLEYILRNTILALLDYPNSTMIGILKMLVDQNFRNNVINAIHDPVIKDFWQKEFADYNDKFRSEAVAPIQNKVGQFVSSPIIRNIIGQTKSTIDMEDIMNNGKILLINLSKGKIGEDNSALLGAMMITKIQLTAMNRAKLPENERRDFYLYVDEFQNFATESFATIFSEARKYHLSIIVANQYIFQMEEAVREAIFGNVGTIISFRVGASDAPFLTKEFAPVFEESDLVNLDKYHVYIKMSIDGVTSPGFSAITLPPKSEPLGFKDKIIEVAREKYSRPREQVENDIIQWSEENSASSYEQKRKVEPHIQTYQEAKETPEKEVESESPKSDSIKQIENDQKINEKIIDSFNIPEAEPKQSNQQKPKGPSGIVKVGDKQFLEFRDLENKKWFQEKLEIKKNEESNNQDFHNQKINDLNIEPENKKEVSDVQLLNRDETIDLNK